MAPGPFHRVRQELRLSYLTILALTPGRGDPMALGPFQRVRQELRLIISDYTGLNPRKG
jgi:hypothetical protein